MLKLCLKSTDSNKKGPQTSLGVLIILSHWDLFQQFLLDIRSQSSLLIKLIGRKRKNHEFKMKNRCFKAFGVLVGKEVAYSEIQLQQHGHFNMKYFVSIHF